MRNYYKGAVAMMTPYRHSPPAAFVVVGAVSDVPQHLAALIMAIMRFKFSAYKRGSYAI